jgi:hypothetical protein
MTDSIKVLGQIAAAATTAEALYTVPSLALVTTSTLVMCNRTTTKITFRVSVHVAGAGADDKQYIFYDTPLNGNSTLSVTIGMTLAEADVVTTYASATGLSFTLFGVETTA